MGLLLNFFLVVLGIELKASRLLGRLPLEPLHQPIVELLTIIQQPFICSYSKITLLKLSTMIILQFVRISHREIHFLLFLPQTNSAIMDLQCLM
jgi:hypothetical protein